MADYKVEFKNLDKIVFENDNVSLPKLPSLIKKYLCHDDIHLQSIMSDVIENGMCACWCGTIGLGYKIAKNTKCNSYVEYVFKD